MCQALSYNQKCWSEDIGGHGTSHAKERIFEPRLEGGEKQTGQPAIALWRQ